MQHNKPAGKYSTREFKYRFSREVQRVRMEKGLTLQELSEYSRISLATLYALELGNFRDWPTIIRLVRFYNKGIRLEFY